MILWCSCHFWLQISYTKLGKSRQYSREIACFWDFDTLMLGSQMPGSNYPSIAIAFLSRLHCNLQPLPNREYSPRLWHKLFAANTDFCLLEAQLYSLKHKELHIPAGLCNPKLGWFRSAAVSQLFKYKIASVPILTGFPLASQLPSTWLLWGIQTMDPGTIFWRSRMTFMGIRSSETWKAYLWLAVHAPPGQSTSTMPFIKWANQTYPR